LKNNYFKHILALLFISIGLSGCGIYSFKDAVIPDNIKTIKIGFIENKARYQPAISTTAYRQAFTKNN